MVFLLKEMWLNIDLEKLIRLRHWLHAHPEVSRHEGETAKAVLQFLNENAKPDEIVFLDGAGFAAVYTGATAGKTVMIRCELDALPIHESNNDIIYRSVYDGVGHKCGHDGHMTILAGLAQQLVERPVSGRVVLLFQPDEETGTGARQCCRHKNFEKIQPDFAFALHNLPGYPVGEVVCKSGTFASEVQYVAIKFSGKEAHSAQPETGVSPSLALAELTLKARDIQARYDRPGAYALVVPVYSQMGVQASGVYPANGELHFTLRSADAAVLESMWQELSQCARNIAELHALGVAFEIKEHFTASVNSQLGFDMIKQVSALLGYDFTTIDHAFRWGEDFGEITKAYTGAMFGLGSGLNRPALHNPDFNFPDEILVNGIQMFAALIELALQQE